MRFAMLIIIVNILIIIQINVSVEAYKNPNTVLGRNVIVHLFEWKWNDIAAECERFLFFKGYGGVQISPPMEHAINTTTRFGPWFERYQPVSYNKFDSRSGTEMQLRNMIRRCNNVGVRIYVDAVINQMSEFSGLGSAGTPFNATSKYFPGVPYGPIHFNDIKCKTASGSIEWYQDAAQVRDCKIEKLPDLATADDFVQNKIAEYMNSLIDMGVAGFRIDNAKHIWPADLEAIYAKLNNLRPDIFGVNKRPFIYQEVIDLNTEPIKSSHYTHLGRVTEFKYGRALSDSVAKRNSQRISYLRYFGPGWTLIPDNVSFVFVDNHDNQRGNGGGGFVLTYKQLKQYKIANAFMLAYPHGIAQVMSSYAFSSNTQGPPLDALGNTNDVIINENEECENGWICEHRWRQIYNMIEFRNLAGSEDLLNWWDDKFHQIAFARGNKAFIAINNDDTASLNANLRTGLQPGRYCDIISGNKVNNQCTGKTLTVDANGFLNVVIPSSDPDPMIAIHVNSKLS